jgi:hypothetical protein
VIHSNIQPQIHGIEIYPININESQVVYVISIPKGQIAYQASDKKFHRRRNTTKETMEVYEINEVNQRGTAPDLEIKFSFHNKKDVDTQNAHLDLNMSILNKNVTPAEYILSRIYIDKSLIKNPEDVSSEMQYMGTCDFLINQNKVSTFEYVIKWSVPHHLPVWQNEPFRLTNHPLRIYYEKGKEYWFGYNISSPNMNKKEFFLPYPLQ